MLRAGGRFAALDAAVPSNPVLRAGNAVWFRGAVPVHRAAPRGRCRRVPLPPEVHGVPARADGARGIALRGRLHRRGAGHDDGRVRAAPHGDAGMTVASARHTELRAVTRAVDERDDLVEHLAPDGFAWIQDGIGFVTAGVAALVEPRSATAFLAAIEHDDEVGAPGTGPLAVGALPFDLTESRRARRPAADRRLPARRAALGHAARAVGARRSRPDRGATCIHRRGAHHARRVVRDRAPRPRDHRARRPREGRARPPGRRHGGPSDRRPTRRRPLARRAARLLRLRVGGARRRNPRAARAATRPGGRVSSDGGDRRRQRRRRARPPPRLREGRAGAPAGAAGHRRRARAVVHDARSSRSARGSCSSRRSGTS